MQRFHSCLLGDKGTLTKQARKRSSSAPLLAAKGQRNIVGLFDPSANSGSSSPEHMPEDVNSAPGPWLTLAMDTLGPRMIWGVGWQVVPCLGLGGQGGPADVGSRLAGWMGGAPFRIFVCQV